MDIYINSVSIQKLMTFVSSHYDYDNSIDDSRDTRQVCESETPVWVECRDDIDEQTALEGIVERLNDTQYITVLCGRSGADRCHRFIAVQHNNGITLKAQGIALPYQWEQRWSKELEKMVKKQSEKRGCRVALILMNSSPNPHRAAASKIAVNVGKVAGVLQRQFQQVKIMLEVPGNAAG